MPWSGDLRRPVKRGISGEAFDDEELDGIDGPRASRKSRLTTIKSIYVWRLLHKERIALEIDGLARRAKLDQERGQKSRFESGEELRLEGERLVMLGLGYVCPCESGVRQYKNNVVFRCLRCGKWYFVEEDGTLKER